MKKSLFALVLSCAVFGTAVAQDIKITPIMDPGTLAVNAGVGYGWSLEVAGGAELVMLQFMVADVVPLTVGAAARAVASIGWLNSVYLDAAGMGTLHVSFKGLKPLGLPADVQDQLDRVDSYIGIGIGLGVLGDRFGKLPIYLTSMNGYSYFLTDNFALNVEYGYASYWGGYGQLGVLFKL